MVNIYCIGISLAFLIIALTNIVTKRRMDDIEKRYMRLIDILDKHASSNIKDLNNVFGQLGYLERILEEKQKVE